MARGEEGELFLAPADPHGRGQRVEICPTSGQRSVLATIPEITAIARHNATTIVAADSSIQTIEADGSIRTLAEDVSSEMYGLAMVCGSVRSD
jgi:hypothetical protein